MFLVPTFYEIVKNSSYIIKQKCYIVRMELRIELEISSILFKSLTTKSNLVALLIYFLSICVNIKINKYFLHYYISMLPQLDFFFYNIQFIVWVAKRTARLFRSDSPKFI
jgi:energy-coupling factor transporter transmembrane protein EcfT